MKISFDTRLAITFLAALGVWIGEFVLSIFGYPTNSDVLTGATGIILGTLGIGAYAGQKDKGGGGSKGEETG